MTKYSKYNLVYRLQKWMDTVEGQTFMNYTYSWGASIVILGALFKLTHLPGANIMLFIGMGTEVLVFFISAFDRPFDKTADGREIPTHITEEYMENGKVSYEHVADVMQQVRTDEPRTAQVSAQGGTQPTATPAGEPIAFASAAPAAYVPQMSAEEAAALNEAQGSYVTQLNELVETLKKVNEQSARLTRDSEEMENLNRTLTGISRVYEMQLKGASQQIGTIDEINDQTRKMARQIDQLNQIYTRMIEAMTVNMPMASPGAASHVTGNPNNL